MTANGARLLQERLGLSDEELLRALDVDPLTLVADEGLAHRPQLRLLLALTADEDPVLLRRWLRATARGRRPVDLLTARDFGAFEDALAHLASDGLRLGG